MKKYIPIILCLLASVFSNAQQYKQKQVVGIAYDSIPYSSTPAWDFTTGFRKTIKLRGNATLSISNVFNGASGTLVVVQDPTGGRTLSIPDGTATLNSGANEVTVIGFTYDGVASKFRWAGGKNNRYVDTIYQDGDTIRFTINGVAHAFFNQTTGGATANGNYGNVQLNRNGALSGSDSLTVDSSTFKTKNTFQQGNNINNIKILTREVPATAGGTSYANQLGSSDRTATIVVTQSGGGVIVPNGNNLNVLVNGNTAESIMWLANGGTVSGAWFQFDLAADSYIVDEIKFYQSTTASHGVWKVQGSHDGVSFTDIGTSFTLGGATTQTITNVSGNSTAYRYYRFTGISGTTSSTPYIREFEFKIGTTGGGGTADSSYNRIQAHTATNIIAINDSIPGQVGIGTRAPVASSVLDVRSTTKGIIFPRMTTTQMNAVSSPANGLIIYNTDSAWVFFYNGSAWTKLSGTGSGGGSTTPVGNNGAIQWKLNGSFYGSDSLLYIGNKLRIGNHADFGAYSLQNSGGFYNFNGDVTLNGNGGGAYDVLNFSTYNFEKNSGDLSITYTATGANTWASHTLKAGNGTGVAYATMNYWYHGAIDQKWYIGPYGTVDYWFQDITGTKKPLILQAGTGRVGVNGITSPTAYLHLPAATATAGTGQLKFESSILPTTPEIGLVNFANGLWYGDSSNAVRDTFAMRKWVADYVAAHATSGSYVPTTRTLTIDGTTQDLSANRTWAIVHPVQNLNSQYTDVGNIGVGEDNLMSYTLPANTLTSDGDWLEINASFVTAANGNTKTLIFYFGTYNNTFSAPSSGARINVKIVITRTGSATQKVTWSYVATGQSFPDGATASIDLTASQVIKFTGTATADNDVIQKDMQIVYHHYTP